MRAFRLISISGEEPFTAGVYKGKRPSQAALKAFNRHCRNHDLEDCVRDFAIEEIIATKEPKQYHYVGERVRLSEKKEVKLNSGGAYTIQYKNVVHKTGR